MSRTEVLYVSNGGVPFPFGVRFRGVERSNFEAINVDAVDFGIDGLGGWQNRIQQTILL